MKTVDLKKDVESIQQRTQNRKTKLNFLSMNTKIMLLLGTALIVIFIAHLIITHFLMLGVMSTLLYVNDLPIASSLFSSMSAQSFGLFLLAIMGLVLLLLARISIRRQRELK